MRRVVVTGLGLVTPLASGVEETWTRLIAGQSGAGPITRFDPKDLRARVACEVPLGDGTNGTFNADDWMTPKERNRIDDFILYGIAAAEMALKDSGWKPETEEEQFRTGVLTGSGIGGLPGIQTESIVMDDRGMRRVSPFFITRCLINLISGNVSIRNNLKGPNHAVVTACSTGVHAIGDAARMIMWDDADVMVAGGAEAAICEMGVTGFAQAKALSTHFANSSLLPRWHRGLKKPGHDLLPGSPALAPLHGLTPRTFGPGLPVKSLWAMVPTEHLMPMTG